MEKIKPEDYSAIVIFTGAGMSAESGIPTYRGKGGIWQEYDWQQYACQLAFDLDPKKVLAFHELRRKSVLDCQPHAGHEFISSLERSHAQVTIVTQNIDGMHQRAGSHNVIELHGSLWRLRCPSHGKREDIGGTFESYRCEYCQAWLRPDITWFEDPIDQEVFFQAEQAIGQAELFVSIGTSGNVWPAAGLAELAGQSGCFCVEVNPELSGMSGLYDQVFQEPASKLSELFI